MKTLSFYSLPYHNQGFPPKKDMTCIVVSPHFGWHILLVAQHQSYPQSEETGYKGPSFHKAWALCWAGASQTRSFPPLVAFVWERQHYYAVFLCWKLPCPFEARQDSCTLYSGSTGRLTDCLPCLVFGGFRC